MKLLHKTLRVYLTFSVIIFVLSIPLFYLLVQKLWMDDVDDSLVFQKEKIVAGISTFGFDSTKMAEFTETAHKIDLGVAITRLSNPAPEKDSIYYLDFYDETRAHVEPFRELSSVVKINGNTYRIKVRKDLVESADLIRGIALTQALLFFLFLTGLILLNHYFSKKTWRPFYRVVEKLNTFRIDKEKAIQPEESDIKEFNELSHSVAQLTKNNIRVFRAQKEFTENAAHETQTPLAAIKNQVDLLAQDNKLTKNQADIIGRMEKNVLRLSHLNRNLLLLAKIDNEQFALEEKVNLDAVIKEVLMVFDEEIALKNIGLNVQGDTRQFIISNAFLLQLLFSNLIKNAVKYNVADGFIAIELNESCFKITNSGKNQTLPREDIFKRFYKTGESNDSTGLGLAIAKRICELLKFDLHYDYEETGRHCFTVIFSKAELMSFN